MRVKKAARRTEAEIESIDARLEEMGRKLDRLRSLYESFFMGIERTPPNAPRRELNRLFLEMQQIPIVVVDDTSQKIYELSANGTLMNTIDISGMGVVTAAGVEDWPPLSKDETAAL